MIHRFSLLLCACAGWAASATAAAASPQVLEPARADFLLSNTPAPPAATAGGWQSRTLPDDWRSSQHGEGGIGWYRVGFNLDAQPGEPWAVLVNHHATAYVNDTPVGGAADLFSAEPRPFMPPRIFEIDARLLKAGANEVLIGIQALPDVQAAGLNGVWVGPARLLRSRYERYYFVKVTACQAAIAIELVMAALFGALWLQRRQDGIYGWFALACAIWAIRPWLLLIRDPLLDHWLWAWLVDVHVMLFVAFVALVSHRYFGHRRPLLERGAFAYTALLFLSLPIYPMLNRSLVLLPALPVPYYILWLGIQQLRRRRGSEELAFAVASILFALAALHDLLSVTGRIPFRTWVVTHFATLALTLILGWVLINRFVQALRAAEITGTELARQVEEKRRELEASYRSMEALRQREAVISERERIMRDLHDGLGGQLVSALALSQGADSSTAAAVTQTLRDALDDLRIVIDSLDPVEGDLLVLLGTVRNRLEPRLAQHGLRFDWRVQDIPPIPGFGPDKALQVLRIVQEAIANVLKHAGARAITVTTGAQVAEARVFVEIRDDGAGFDGPPAHGRGLRNMTLRAERIGGSLSVASSGAGTTVRLSLPLVTTG